MKSITATTHHPPTNPTSHHIQALLRNSMSLILQWSDSVLREKTQRLYKLYSGTAQFSDFYDLTTLNIPWIKKMNILSHVHKLCQMRRHIIFSIISINLQLFKLKPWTWLRSPSLKVNRICAFEPASTEADKEILDGWFRNDFRVNRAPNPSKCAAWLSIFMGNLYTTDRMLGRETEDSHYYVFLSPNYYLICTSALAKWVWKWKWSRYRG